MVEFQLVSKLEHHIIKVHGVDVERVTRTPFDHPNRQEGAVFSHALMHTIGTQTHALIDHSTP